MQQLVPSCPYCGHSPLPQARFCARCGALLRPLSAEQTTLRRQAPTLERRAAAVWPGGTRLGAENRYWIEALIGQGGFGQVYLAHDTRLDRLCVVKRLVLNPHWNAEVRRAVAANFSREAALLVSLNSPGHPNIPEIYDYLEGQLCLVMKYIAGSSLADLLRERGGRLREAEALRIAREICAALVYMHGRPTPVLHRDIKPANVLIDAAKRVWVIDFGLSKALPFQIAPVAALESQLVGTLGFAPPEQWRGQAGPPADIYALAATLRLLLTGHRPEHSSLIEIGAGIAAWPPLRAEAPELSPALEPLLARALAAQPEDRPDALGMLAELEGLLRLAELPAPPEPARPPLPAHFVGRALELATLGAELRQAHAVAICGMPGVGKSSLAAALASAHAAADRIFWHRFHHGEGAEPLCWALAGFLARHGRVEPWRLLHAARQTGTPPPVEQLAGYLAPLLRDGGFLVCLDDWQAVAQDNAVVPLIERLASEARAGSLDLLITARQSPAFLPTALALPGLSPTDARALLALRDLELPTELAAQLHELTEGNPQLLTLAIDALRHSLHPALLLSRLADSPEVERFLLREVDEGLSPEERAVMGAVALLAGQGGTRETIQAALDSGGLRRTLASLTTRHLLTVSHGAGEPHYQQHTIVRRFYAASLARRERQMLHRRLVEHFAGEAGGLIEATRHAVLAGDTARAAELGTRDLPAAISRGQAEGLGHLLAQLPPDRLPAALAAEVFTARGELSGLLGDHMGACIALEQALTFVVVTGPGPAEAQARRYRLLALAASRGGDYERAEAACQAGLGLVLGQGEVGAEAARLYAQLAEISMRRGDFLSAEAACHAGLLTLPDPPARPRARAALLQRLAVLAGQRGHYAEAVAGLEHSLELARQGNTPALTAAILSNLGYFAGMCNQRAHALAAYAECQQLSERIGDVEGQIASWINQGILLQARGDYAAAAHSFTQARALCERLDLPDPLAGVLTNQGYLLLMQGQADAAAATLHQALDLSRALKDDVGVVDTLYRLGDALLALGDTQAALAHAAEARSLARALGNSVYEACALRVLGEALLVQGDSDGAAEHLEAARRLQDQVGDQFDTALLLAALARLARARGDASAAMALRDQGLALARAQALAYPEQLLTALAQA